MMKQREEHEKKAHYLYMYLVLVIVLIIPGTDDFHEAIYCITKEFCGLILSWQVFVY